MKWGKPLICGPIEEYENITRRGKGESMYLEMIATYQGVSNLVDLTAQVKDGKTQNMATEIFNDLAILFVIQQKNE